ncbi:MAG TPA: L,D-transpeptidase family protein [Thermoanaerobaculia bacterium]
MTVRRLRHALPTAVLAACVFSGTAAAQDDVAAILREAAQNGVLTGLKWPRFPDYRDELTALYSQSGWRPVWSERSKPTPAARAAIDVLRAAEERGLHPEDYDAETLARRSGELGAGRDVAWFDVALSVGILRHLSDLHIGRVNPARLAIGINVERKKSDLARVLGEAIDRGRIAEIVREAEPRFVQYRNLKAAYAKYLALAEDSTLPTVTAPKTVRPGDQFDEAPALRRRLAAFGDLPQGAITTLGADNTVYDSVTAAAVKRFQTRHGLPADGVLGPTIVAALNVPPARRARQIELALERIRWLPALDTGPFVVVNVPSFQLYAFDSLPPDGAPSLIMNVVVGRAEVGRQTPLFERDMRYVIFRPYWVIPPSILRKEILPAIRRNSRYLARNDMEVYSGSGDTGPALPATAANLARVARGELGIRQRPGPRNALGPAKFIFPNDQNVYFHGTPATELFSRTRRDFSHGCVRLEDPARFAVWVLRDPVAWSAGEVRRALTEGPDSRRVNLKQPLAVVIYYVTAIIRPGTGVEFYEDIYGHDARLERELAKGYPFEP